MGVSLPYLGSTWVMWLVEGTPARVILNLAHASSSSTVTTVNNQSWGDRSIHLLSSAWPVNQMPTISGHVRGRTRLPSLPLAPGGDQGKRRFHRQTCPNLRRSPLMPSSSHSLPPQYPALPMHVLSPLPSNPCLLFHVQLY